MSAFDKLNKLLEELESDMNKILASRAQQLTNMQSVFEDIQSDMQESIGKTMQVLESTSKGLGFTVTIARILSNNNFQFNSQISICYRNLKFTGNEKPISANEQINQKFVLPVLEGKQSVEIQIWKIEQDEKQVFETFKINLRDMIGMQSDDNKFQLSSKSETNPSNVLVYIVEVNGFGFNSWKRRNDNQSQVSQTCSLSQSHIVSNTDQTILKPVNLRAQEQKKGLNQLFEKRTARLAETKLQSFDNHMSELDDIMNLLADI